MQEMNEVFKTLKIMTQKFMGMESRKMCLVVAEYSKSLIFVGIYCHTIASENQNQKLILLLTLTFSLW